MHIHMHIYIYMYKHKHTHIHMLVCLYMQLQEENSKLQELCDEKECMEKTWKRHAVEWGKEAEVLFQSIVYKRAQFLLKRALWDMKTLCCRRGQRSRCNLYACYEWGTKIRVNHIVKEPCLFWKEPYQTQKSHAVEWGKEAEVINANVMHEKSPVHSEKSPMWHEHALLSNGTTEPVLYV